MLPEQQQRILGYFIEEAKDHLNTIEQGLLNLQATIGNPEMANEVFRAAHSVKGGAAMLGIESMQRTSHRMEDYFKLLKEAPIKVDRSLESMFLRVFDALQELLEQLQGPFGLTEEKEQSIMSGVEPVFQQLQEHLDKLVDEADPNDVPVAAAPVIFTTPSPQPVEESALKLVFSSDVSAALREMLARFKQADTEESRAALEGCCQLLERFGEQFNLPTWMNLVKHGRWAVCDRNNDYRTLAPVLIKEIKKAQDLVLAGREPEIALSQTLQTLAAKGDAVEASDDLDSLFSDDALFAENDLDSGLTSDTDDLVSLAPDLSFDALETSSSDTDDGLSLDELLNDAATTSPSGPEVGAAELTSLADLFETGGSALDSDWQEEDVPITEAAVPAESLDIDISPDFEDLLNDDSSDLGASPNDFESGSELADLFGDTADTVQNLNNADGGSGGDQPTADDIESASSENIMSMDSLFGDGAAVETSASVDDLFGDLESSEGDDEPVGLDSLGELDAVAESATDDESGAADLDLSSDNPDGVDLSADSFFDAGSADSDGSSGAETDPERSEFDEFFTLDDTASDPAKAIESDALSSNLWGQDDNEPEGLLASDSLSDDIWAEPDQAEESKFSGLDLGSLAQNPAEDAEALDLDDVWASVEDIPLGEEAADANPTEAETSLDNGLDNLFGDAVENPELEADTPAAADGLDGLFDDAAVDEDADLLSGHEPATDASLDDGNSLDNLFSDATVEAAELPSEPDESATDASSLENGLDGLFDDAAVEGLELSSDPDTSDEAGASLGDDAGLEGLFGGDAVEGADLLSEMGETATESAPDEEGLDNLFGDAAESSELSSALDSELDELTAPLDDGLEGLFDGDAAENAELPSDLKESDASAESLGGLLSDDAETEGTLDDLFSDAEVSIETGATSDIVELDALESLELTALDSGLPEISDLGTDSPIAETSSLDTDITSQPPSSNIEFDLLDLDDGGIVTGIVADDDDGFGGESVELGADDTGLDLLMGMTEAVPPAPDAGFTINAEEPPELEDPLADAVIEPAQRMETDNALGNLEPLDSLLSELPAEIGGATAAETADIDDEFGDLDALLDAPDKSDSPIPDAPSDVSDIDDEFGDLEALLQEADQTLSTTSSSAASYRPTSNRLSSRRVVTDQTMRVSVSHLDNLSNLVGELVVNRNTLEQDQERLRQFLDNLLFQVQQLNDVGQRMRDLYERSLLESSLISSRQSYQTTAANAPNASSIVGDHATGESFDALEMDRFTGFHTLSQEMIELIVRVRESASDIAYTVESSDQVTRQFRQVTNQLQEGLNKARMVQFAQTAARLPRAVRDISVKCGKEARLVVEGRDILIDKMILEQLYDPMTHLVNNAITHGVETPEQRRQAGKEPEGVITVRAFYQGNQTVISVGDDGAGIDPDIVKQKALQKGLISQADVQTMTVLDVYDLLFHPGFSTRDQADDFAGRGFGMDVVRTSLADIRGNITIDSEPGHGTNFTIRLPLTLSISKALSCISNQARIAFPMDGVEDMFDVSRERIQKNDQGQDCILWRDTLLPFQNLSDLLSFNRTLGRGRVYGGNQDENMISIVVLRSANSFIALEVDQVMGEQEIVIKQLEGPVPKPTGIAGATVLGDGRVMPIADVLELIDLALGRVRRDPTAAVWAQVDEAPPPEETAKVKSEPTVLIVDDSITVRELLSMSFNKVGYRVEQARDGQEAWEKLRSGLPCDLVFCDIEMPRMDGLELLSRLQKDGGLQQIPIAMLTSRGADRHRQMAVDLGASGYFTKPYLEEALLDAANKMLHGEKLV
ncbi:MAG: response regulator [Cyanobacteria bacterium J06554_1]